MIDIFIANDLADELKITPPADFSGTIDSVNGNVVSFTSATSWDKDAWRGCMISITSGGSNRLRNVVMASLPGQLILAVPFPPGKVPVAGDTFTLSGGPLAKAVIYLEEPASIVHDWDAGKRFFINIDPTSGELTPSAMGGRAHSGVETAKRNLSINVLVCTKHSTGLSNSEDIYRLVYELPLLKEQVMCLIHAWRTNAEKRMFGVGEIAWGKVIEEISGGEPLKGYIIAFDVAFGRAD